MDGKLLEPMARKDGELTEVDYHEAFMLTAKKAESLAAKYGRNAVAVAVSDRYTNEEAYVIKSFADSIGAKTLCFNNRENGLEKVLGVNATPNTINELLSAEVILCRRIYCKRKSGNPSETETAAERSGLQRLSL